MDGIDKGNLIGALELGDHLTSFYDGALEAVGAYAALGPTQGCPTSGLACLTNVCRPHVDDGALLQAFGHRDGMIHTARVALRVFLPMRAAADSEGLAKQRRSAGRWRIVRAWQDRLSRSAAWADPLELKAARSSCSSPPAFGVLSSEVACF